MSQIINSFSTVMSDNWDTESTMAVSTATYYRRVAREGKHFPGNIQQHAPK